MTTEKTTVMRAECRITSKSQPSGDTIIEVYGKDDRAETERQAVGRGRLYLYTGNAYIVLYPTPGEMRELGDSLIKAAETFRAADSLGAHRNETTINDPKEFANQAGEAAAWAAANRHNTPRGME